MIEGIHSNNAVVLFVIKILMQLLDLFENP